MRLWVDWCTVVWRVLISISSNYCSLKAHFLHVVWVCCPCNGCKLTVITNIDGEDMVHIEYKWWRIPTHVSNRWILEQDNMAMFRYIDYSMFAIFSALHWQLQRLLPKFSPYFLHIRIWWMIFFPGNPYHDGIGMNYYYSWERSLRPQPSDNIVYNMYIHI